jgi:hypothetical protein
MEELYITAMNMLVISQLTRINMNWIQASIIFGPMIIATIFFWDDIK